MFQPLGRFVYCVVFASALSIPGDLLIGQTADGPNVAPSIDPEKRLQWLSSRVPPKVAVSPKVGAPPKITFRTNPQVVGTHPVEVPPAETRSADARPTNATPAELSSAKTRSAESRPAKTNPTTLAKLTAPTVAAEPSPAKIPTTEARSTPGPKSTPAPSIAEPAPTKTPSSKPNQPTSVSAANRPAKAAPTPLAKLTPPTVVPQASPANIRSAEARSTPIPKSTPAPVIAETRALKSQSPKPRVSTSGPGVVESRYPWKTGIVTTVFWVGEPVSGNNCTPNFSSSWDSNWAGSYGGFDNPSPASRRNFIPVKFAPRQNPFYVALPYNDVTRGTTKPEARRVIPWFKEAFRKEGQSVCRDRWVAIRNRAGKVGYAQWSDCGPFRTDHWQYVFGNEKPKPNLNKGAGLDTSPALRDYLGLESTDITDWKFVDFKDVPSGPWALYGQNNTFVQKGSRSPRGTAKASGRTADNSSQIRVREF